LSDYPAEFLPKLETAHARCADSAVCVALPQRAPPSLQREHGVKVDQSLRGGRRGERLRNKVKSVFAPSFDRCIA
jgi:hypothetical protein